MGRYIMSIPSEEGKQEQQFFQLVLLLVNIIQGIALAALAAQGITVFEADELSFGAILRLIASFFVIWLITFEYAAFYVMIWPPTNGAFDIFIIMITGVLEYVTIHFVGTPIKWLGFLTLLSGWAVISYLNSHTTLTHETMASFHRQIGENLALIRQNNIVSIRLTATTTGVALLLWLILYLFRARCINYIAPVFAIGYCGYILLRSSRFLAKYSTPLKVDASG